MGAADSSYFMMFFLQTRHQQGDSFPLTVDEILDETNQLDVGAKHRHWLATEVSKMFSSKMEQVVE